MLRARNLTAPALVAELELADAEAGRHFIRCIKPNSAQAALRLEDSLVRSQLSSCGVLQAAKVGSSDPTVRV